ncbi:MAG: cysteine synthase A [Clostridia bacterium]|nr:cysteine synthase A [Clostridia bacterium]
MSNIYDSVTELIGRTPLLRLHGIEREFGLEARLLAKLESFNPAGSAKDRIAAKIIKDAEDSGLLTEGAVIIEPTSGNTGIALAAIGAARGYRVIIVMPDTMSIERRKLISAYGAEVVLSDGALGMAGAIALAKDIAEGTENAFIAGQFYNPANPKAHYDSTGPEIYADTDGDIDIFIAGVGTGGTISGTGRYLKEQNPEIKIIAVEPKDSPMLSEGKKGAHGIQGIGAGFIPDTLDTDVYDEILTVELKCAKKSANALARCDGILTGISSGAALDAAIRMARREENRGKSIVVLLPDTGERYLSADLFD